MKSWVISVSLGTGCYRHLQIPGAATLDQVHRAFAASFGLPEAGNYVFSMKKDLWPDGDVYVSAPMENIPQAAGVKLGKFSLERDFRFRYLTGEFTFRCRVLRGSEEKVAGFRVLRSVGEAPRQPSPYDPFPEE